MKLEELGRHLAAMRQQMCTNRGCTCNPDVTNVTIAGNSIAAARWAHEEKCLILFESEFDE